MTREERIQKLAEAIWRELVIEWGWGEISAWPEAYRRAEKSIK